MSGIKNALIFIIGAGVGAATTWFVLKPRYERLTQEQIDSVKEHYKKKYTGEPENEETGDILNEEPEYNKAVTELGYSRNLNDDEGDTTVENIESMLRPYVIAPEDFGEYDEYERISLTYYADSILADEDDEIVEDVENVVGFESLNHFGEYEDDSVYVRNERRKVDYEILLDTRRYSDVINKNKPYRMDD